MIDVAGPDDAPGIVFIHGSVVTRKMWGPQMRALADHLRVIALDLPGHGDNAGSPFTFDRAVAAVQQVIERHASGKAVVVGLSLGGYVAIEHAARWPDSVRGLVLAGTTVNGTGLLGWYLKAIGAVMRRGWLMPSAATLERKTRALFPPQLSTDAEAQIAAGLFPAALPGAFSAMAGRDFAARLGDYSGPTLLVNGAADRRACRGAPGFAAAARHASVHVIEGAGHACNLDRPEAFNSLVRQFCGSI